MRFVMSKSGVGELLKSEEMAKICEEHAEQIRGRCGEGYGVDTRVGKTRVNAMVKPDSADAYYDNLRNNTILKALGG